MLSSKDFQVGDKFRCIDEDCCSRFTFNRVYEIFSIIEDKIYFMNDYIEPDWINVFDGIIKVSQDVEFEPVNKVKNPKSTHYEIWLGYEAIDIIKNTLSENEYIGFLKGNILKYQLRLGKKDNVDKEIEKIKDYQRELNSILEDK